MSLHTMMLLRTLIPKRYLLISKRCYCFSVSAQFHSARVLFFPVVVTVTVQTFFFPFCHALTLEFKKPYGVRRKTRSATVSSLLTYMEQAKRQQQQWRQQRHKHQIQHQHQQPPSAPLPRCSEEACDVPRAAPRAHISTPQRASGAGAENRVPCIWHCVGWQGEIEG